MRILLLLLICSLSSPAHALDISNFRSGLACTNSSPGGADEGWICHATQDIHITDQGRCSYAGKDRLCTWAGFEFDYRNAAAGDKLDCTVETSRPIAFGNPNEQLAQDSSLQTFAIDLNPGSGHLYNPQYFTFVAAAPDAEKLVNTGRSSYQGKQVFEYVYRLHYPLLPDRGDGV